MIERQNPLAEPLRLPCGVSLPNRMVKSAMSDMLGDGEGNPTEAQIRLYRRWAMGGAALSILGEVQTDPRFPESPGNLVLEDRSDSPAFRGLATAVAGTQSQLWLQLGHAGALAHETIGRRLGPSPLDLPGLRCEGMTAADIEAAVDAWAAAARRAKEFGFGGVQIHAAHGFLLSQFLSPLFNRRTDAFGGPVENRAGPILMAIAAIRDAVGPEFPVGLKINCTDRLKGGLEPADALRVIEMLDRTSLDLIEISGGTYFPGAGAAFDASGGGVYFADFGRKAKQLTSIPVVVTGGVKTRDDAERLLAEGAADLVGLARALVLDPDLPAKWLGADCSEPVFPRFERRMEGGTTAWFTSRIRELAYGAADTADTSQAEAIAAMKSHEQRLAVRWAAKFGPGPRRKIPAIQSRWPA